MKEEVGGENIFEEINHNSKIYSRLLPRNLIQIEYVKKWMIEKRNPKSKIKQKDIRKFERIWDFIKEHFLRPYNNLKKPEDKKRFIELVMSCCDGITPKEFEHIIQVILELEAIELEDENKQREKDENDGLDIRERLQLDESFHIIDDERKSPTLSRARQIQDWMTKHKSNILVLRKKNNNTEDSVIAGIYYELKNGIVKKYKSLKTERERQEFLLRLKRYGLSEETLMEVLTIIEKFRVERQKEDPIYYQNAKLIEAWILEHGETPKNNSSSSPEEGSLCRKLTNIRLNLINPFLLCETDEEIEKFLTKLETGKSGITREQFAEIVRIYRLAVEKRRPEIRVTTKQVGEVSYTADAIECDVAEKIMKMLERNNGKKK